MVNFQLTLAILKPHIIKNPIALSAIKNLIVSENFKLVRSKKHFFILKEAELFYEEHKHKFFYNRLVTFMRSGQSELYILAKINAIEEWRKLMGPTKVFKSVYKYPDTIRGKFGLSDTRNVTHGSDSLKSAEREIEIIFPDFDVEKWYKEEETLFRENKVLFSKRKFLHEIVYLHKFVQQ